MLKRQLKAELLRRGYLFTKTTDAPVVMQTLGFDVKRIERGRGTPSYVGMITRLENEQPEVIRTILDIGANVGTIAIRLAESFPKATIFAFEPVRSTFEQLVTNTRDFSQIKCFHSAVGSREGSAEVFLRGNSQLHSLTPGVNISIGLGNETVAVTTISRFVQELSLESIDILKSDTEGFEMEVLMGAEPILDSHRLRYVVAEVGFREDDLRHTMLSGVLEYLNAKGFNFNGLYDPQKNKAGGLEFANALFVNPSLRFQQ